MSSAGTAPPGIAGIGRITSLVAATTQGRTGVAGQMFSAAHQWQATFIPFQRPGLWGFHEGPCPFVPAQGGLRASSPQAMPHHSHWPARKCAGETEALNDAVERCAGGGWAVLFRPCFAGCMSTDSGLPPGLHADGFDRRARGRNTKSRIEGFFACRDT